MRALLACVLAAPVIACAAAAPAPAEKPARAPLRVCADPNNLPFSDRGGLGFENRLAELVAADLGTRVEYTWWPQRRGFVRSTLKAGLCDVLMGVPGSFELALTTRPYYRSSYVFVAPLGSAAAAVASFDDPALRRLRIAVQVIGDDYANAPPAHALSNRGIRSNVVGFTVYGDYSHESPPARIVDAVAAGSVDMAVVWGPLAGWAAARQPRPLHLQPVSPAIDPPFLPFVFDIAMGVRHGEAARRDELDAVLVRRRVDIDALLAEFHVPRVERRYRSADGGGA
jgi:mxaJ protein